MKEKPSIIGTTKIKRVRFGDISTPYRLPPIPAYVSRLLIAQRDADVEWYESKGIITQTLVKQKEGLV